MDDKRTDRLTAKTSDRPDVSRTESQTGLDTAGRSPDYDVSLTDGSDILRDGVIQEKK